MTPDLPSSDQPNPDQPRPDQLGPGQPSARPFAPDEVEISPRFRKTIEQRIARLEEGADWDEAQLELLDNLDHIRRQRQLIAAQRAEALRMRLFLDRSRPRLPRPLIAL